jgi:hypothetical protein
MVPALPLPASAATVAGAGKHFWKIGKLGNWKIQKLRNGGGKLRK